MRLTEDDIVQVLRLVEESTFDELHLETGDLKLLVRKRGCGTSFMEASAPRAKPESLHAASARDTKKPSLEPSTATGGKAEAATRQQGAVAIKAPLLGTVYRRPAPESPPYIETGSFVKEDDTVCLIEVMKVFTAVKAGVRGFVTEVLVETNEMVEYGQPLFMVKPEQTP
jgi:acetyl-CoA carboxylase biotin carboxyl carrier protein